MTTVRQVESELLTVHEAAAELRVAAPTVKRWLRTGTLPGVRLPGGDWRVPIDSLRALRTHAVHDHRRRDEPASSREPS